MGAWNFFGSLFRQERNDIRSILGAARHTVVDVSAGAVQMVEPQNSYTDPADAAKPKKGCRYFEVDEAGTIKFDYTDDNGNTTMTRVMDAVQGINHYGNITQVYRYSDDEDSVECTAKVRNENGDLVIGMVTVY